MAARAQDEASGGNGDAPAGDAGASTPKKRARADRGAPKPFKNAYLHFSRARRADVAAAHADWSVQQVSAEIGRQWKALAPAERKPWVELAQFDKARFQSEVEQYVDRARGDQEKAPRVHIPFKRKKRPDEPRQPDTAYTFFWKSRRAQVVAENPHLSAPLVSREVGRQWKALSDDDRQVWNALAEQDKLRFQQEIAQYSPPPEDIPATLLAKPIKDPYAPKPAKTGFQLFMNHNRESFTLLQMSLNEFRAEMSRIWKQLSDQDKGMWHEMAKQDQQRYEAELDAYKPPAYLSTTVLRASRRLEEFKKAARSDPNAPRLPVSAYSFFLSSNRRDIQAQRPGLKHNEVMREVGVTWKSLSDAERQPFLAQAECDVERFKREMEFYLLKSQKEQLGLTANGVRKAKKRSTVGRPRKTPVKHSFANADGATTSTLLKGGKDRKLIPPRRPQTAYNIMYMSKRAEVLATYQVSHNECSALCGRLWRQMTDAEREPFQRMANEDKLRYAAELKEYRAKLEAANKANDAQESVGFRCFAVAKRRESEGLTLQDISAIWTSMSEQHQVLWEELAADRGQDQSGGLEQQEEEEQRQLEENARAILAAREMRFSFDESAEHDGRTHELPAPAAPSTDDDDDEGGQLGHEDSYHYPPYAYGSNNDEHEQPDEDGRYRRTMYSGGGAFEDVGGGFAHYVASKKAERIGWTKSMWVNEWASLPEDHRNFWEDLALERPAEAIGGDHIVSSPSSRSRRLSSSGGSSSNFSGSDGGEDDSEADGGRDSLDADAICDLLPATAGSNQAEVDAFV